MKKKISVNIDHIATLRNARTDSYYYIDIGRVCDMVMSCGAYSITCHPRSDYRHITKKDIDNIIHHCGERNFKLNIEIDFKNHDLLDSILEKRYDGMSICFVPEKMNEETTESGVFLDNSKSYESMKISSKMCKDSGVTFNIFADPLHGSSDYIEDLLSYDPSGIEINSHRLFLSCFKNKENDTSPDKETNRIIETANFLKERSYYSHIGHGITYECMYYISKIPYISVVSIGHFLVYSSIIDSLDYTIKRSLNILNL